MAIRNSGIFDRTLRMTNNSRVAVAARYAAAKKARWIAFFLTKEEEDMVLLGIALGDGSEIGRILKDEKQLQIIVDVIGSCVYYFKNKSDLLAHDF